MFGETPVVVQTRRHTRGPRHADAKADLEKALTVDGRKWVQGRTHLELGKLAQKAGMRGPAAETFPRGGASV